MKLPRRGLHIIGRAVLLLCTFFSVTAAVGWWREKRDVQVIQELFREREAQIRAAVAEVGEGVPLERFRKLLPGAYYDEDDQEWVVWIPTGYSETPGCTNTFKETGHFRLDGAIVRPVEFKSGRVFSHGDRFGPGGIWYYFWRAWYSSVDDYTRQGVSDKPLGSR